jgi:hypothetical protein
VSARARWLAPFALALGCSTTAPPPVDHPDDDGEGPANDDGADPRPRGDGGPQISAEVGALDEDAVKRTFAEVKPKVLACFKRANAGLPFAVVGGEVEVRLRVSGDGSLRYVHPTRSTLGHRETERCICDTLAQVTWPKPQGGDEGQAETFYTMDPPARRAPFEWSEADLGGEGAELKRKLGACMEKAQTTALSLTLYVDPDGKVISAGGACGDENGPSAIDCGISAARAMTFPSPGSYPAKVTVAAPAP